MAGEINSKDVWPMIDGAIIGGLGGIVNHLRKKPGHDWGQLFVSVITAAFSGLLAQLVTGWLGYDIRLQFALAGIAGYGGGVILDDVVRRFRRILNGSLDTIADMKKKEKKE